MTKEELKTALKDFGSKGKQIADELYEKLETEKEELDTQTRRKVRVFWIGACVVSFLIGLVFSHILQSQGCFVMEKRVVAAVSSSLPSPTMAGATAAPIVGIEGLNFCGVSVSDWMYILAGVFYLVSAIHVIYKIYVRHEWVKKNLENDGIVKVTQVVDNSDIVGKIVTAQRKAELEARKKDAQ